MKRRRGRSYLILFAGMFMFVLLSVTQTIGGLTPTLTWDDPVTGDMPDGYIISYDFDSGAPYGIEVNVGYTNEYTVPMALNPSDDYYFIATGYNVDGIGHSTREIHYSTADSDGDGVLDGDEENQYGTNMNMPDTDGDGINDYDEIDIWGVGWSTDTDGDGLIDLLDPDSDNDGLLDGEEYYTYNTNPAVSDSDSDGIDDYDELVMWGNDWNADFDGDGIINLLDPDSDGDGIVDGQDANPGTIVLGIVSPTVVLNTKTIISTIL